MSEAPTAWQTSACILCSQNCGIKVQLDEQQTEIVRIKGDDDHPISQGYLCNKASRLNYYQNRADRLLSPMRRNASGGYDAVDWDTALGEIAAKLEAVKNDFGGDKIFFYGGGGQGNHLGGGYSRTVIQPLGVRYRSNALAQEKTGEFWVADRMLGGWNHGDFEHAQVVIFLGKNPWQSHGISRARATLRDIAKNPDRTLIVIDPKRTQTADLADIHLAVRPARDAWLLAGMIATLVQEDRINHAWIAEHAEGLVSVSETFIEVDVTDCAEKSGIDEAVIRSTARLIADAESVALLEDLGIQMNRHSTLVSYLQRLLWLLTGHFGRPGTHFLPLTLANLAGGKETGVSPVLGSRLINGLVPCNDVATEVLADHPNRYRAMIIDSGNPVHSLAESSLWRKAMRHLDVSVCIDVAMTETALQADYVLPATSQYEKAEATFFSAEFPDNMFHLRKPLFQAPEGPLDEAEIYWRLAQALDLVPEGIVEELMAVLDAEGRDGFRDHVFRQLAAEPALGAIGPGLLYRTLGQTLPEGMQNGAALWALCHSFAATHRTAVEQAGFSGEGMALGEALFDGIISSPSGMIYARENYDQMWQRLPGGRVNLDLPELLEVAATLNEQEPQETSADFPFLLAAGERRDFTANTIIRNPAWSRKDQSGALHIHPDDAARLNLGEGSSAKITTEAGAMPALVSLNDRMQRGFISLPNGMGLTYPDEYGVQQQTGTSPNELTVSSQKDAFVGTPWHKSVPARVEAVD
ncbi:MAG TPA: molybdopterin oxidoreductase [Gammaproteobacteria bacterium]|nr:MAG: molybdopterin oxidoreductase family protein [Gammaproteobacteria bacterium TMED134]HAL41767.1 molybdopterin oxidoreductase [Gammaproteobacteria bacterium]|tara:strand:+ start:23030 stop:25285 length:2256 start_codon:yes stop_codon:yes gene_type:complete